MTETGHSAGLILPRHAHACANLTFAIGGPREWFNNYAELRTFARRSRAARSLIRTITERRGVCLAGGDERPAPGDIPTPTFSTGRGSRSRDDLTGHFLHIHQECNSDRCATSLVVEGLILEIRPAGRERPARRVLSPPWLRRIRDLIHDCPNSSNPVPTGAEVDQATRVICSMFRRFYGCSVGQYVRLRPQAGGRNDLHGQSVGPSSCTCGFYVSHFTHAFRRLFKMTPGSNGGNKARRFPLPIGSVARNLHHPLGVSSDTKRNPFFQDVGPASAILESTAEPGCRERFNDRIEELRNVF